LLIGFDRILLNFDFEIISSSHILGGSLCLPFLDMDDKAEDIVDLAVTTLLWDVAVIISHRGTAHDAEVPENVKFSDVGSEPGHAD
jgi:hypothetical protein